MYWTSIGWLREYDDSPRPVQEKPDSPVDPYSFHASIEAVLTYLDKVDPEGASRVRYRYVCVDHLARIRMSIGYATGFGLSE